MSRRFACYRTQYNNRLDGIDFRIGVSAPSTSEGAMKTAQRVENFFYAQQHDR